MMNSPVTAIVLMVLAFYHAMLDTSAFSMLIQNFTHFLCPSLFLCRLEKFTKGSETIYRQLRRNKQGNLGFIVNYEGIIMEVQESVDGLKQSSRLVEVTCLFFFVLSSACHDE